MRSMGHIADRGFQNDRFIPSQLVMIDHNTLAQRWEVSFIARAETYNQLNQYTEIWVYLFL